MMFWLTILEEIGCAAAPTRLCRSLGFCRSRINVVGQIIIILFFGDWIGTYVFSEAGPWRLKHFAFSRLEEFSSELNKFVIKRGICWGNVIRTFTRTYQSHCPVQSQIDPSFFTPMNRKSQREYGGCWLGTGTTIILVTTVVHELTRKLFGTNYHSLGFSGR